MEDTYIQGYFYWDWSDSVEKVSHLDSKIPYIYVTPTPSATYQIGGIIIKIITIIIVILSIMFSLIMYNRVRN